MGPEPVCHIPQHGCDECSRHYLYRRMLGVAGWLAAAVAALSVASLPFEIGESWCGIWGCLPPVPALAALHLLWGVGLGAAGWAIWLWRPAAIRSVGGILILAAVVTTAAVVVRDVFRWFDHVPDADHRHWPRRALYTLAVRTDLPILQALVAGVAGTMIGRRSCRSPGVGPINQPDSVVDVLVPSNVEKS